MLRSAVCRRNHFDTDWYTRAAGIVGVYPGVAPPNGLPISYRKNWEFCAITEALLSRGMLEPGRKALGFAVGNEPLPSAFAARGLDILATDLMADDAGSDRWSASGQHAASLDALFHPHLIDQEAFAARVRFEAADMRDLSGFADETYDFVWSSCALEHIGTLQDGWQFILDAMRLVKPGGMAVHTTECNLSSNDRTVPAFNCLYRKRDVEELDRLLRPMRCGLEAMDWDAGTEPDDLDVDVPPYFQGTSPHIKLELDGFVSTSMMLVVRKGP